MGQQHDQCYGTKAEWRYPAPAPCACPVSISPTNLATSCVLVKNPCTLCKLKCILRQFGFNGLPSPSTSSWGGAGAGRLCVSVCARLSLSLSLCGCGGRCGGGGVWILQGSRPVLTAQKPRTAVPAITRPHQTEAFALHCLNDHAITASSCSCCRWPLGALAGNALQRCQRALQKLTTNECACLAAGAAHFGATCTASANRC